MFKTRQNKLEEEAKKEENYIPTKDLKADAPIEKDHVRFSLLTIILLSLLIISIIVCIVLIFVNGGPVKQ